MWINADGDIEIFSVSNNRVFVSTLELSGRITTQRLDAGLDEVFVTDPAVSVRTIDESTVVSVGGFNDDGHLLRYDRDGTLWQVQIIDDVEVGVAPGSTTIVSSDLLVPSWAAWHLFYLNDAGEVRSTWTAFVYDENLDEFVDSGVYYDNDLALLPGLGSFLGTDIDAVQTAWGTLHVSLVRDSELLVVWWAASFEGSWVTSNLSDQFGPSAQALQRGAIETFFDANRGDLYIYTIRTDGTDAVLYRWDRAADSWTQNAVRIDLGLSEYRAPDRDVFALDRIDSNFAVTGSIDQGNELPQLVVLFTFRLEGDTLPLIDTLDSLIVDPIDV